MNFLISIQYFQCTTETMTQFLSYLLKNYQTNSSDLARTQHLHPNRRRKLELDAHSTLLMLKVKHNNKMAYDLINNILTLYKHPSAKVLISSPIKILNHSIKSVISSFLLPPSPCLFSPSSLLPFSFLPPFLSFLLPSHLLLPSPSLLPSY